MEYLGIHESTNLKFFMLNDCGNGLKPMEFYFSRSRLELDACIR